jgi:arylsulfatase A-like enzyme
MHLFGLHYPNDVHPEVPRYGPTMEDGYDHELRFVDLQLKDLFETFEARDPKPIVIITGDHGETIAPWMRSHGFGLDEPTMRVPLLIKGPGIKPGTFQEPVSLVDLMPTLLALTKTPGPVQLDGVNLAPLLTGQASEPLPGTSPRYVLTDCWRFAPDRSPYLDAVGASDGRRVVFYDRATGLVSSPGFEDQLPYAVPAQAAVGDPLARFALGYTEEFAAEPIH